MSEPTEKGETVVSLRGLMGFHRPDWFFIRTPVLSWDEITRLGMRLDGAHQLRCDEKQLGAVLDADRNVIREWMNGLIGQPLIAEALFLASEELSSRIQPSSSLNSDNSAGLSALELALGRYLVRMAGRVTPFGLFAGCAVGNIGDSTQFAMNDVEHFKRTTRLDAEYLHRLCDVLIRRPEIRNHLRWFPNSSLYLTSGAWHYYEVSRSTQNVEYSLVRLEDQPQLRLVMEAAAEGATIGALSSKLVDGDITISDAEQFVEELIQAQVLVPELAPPVTGAGALNHMIEVLDQCPAPTSPISTLKVVRETLREIDSLGPGVDRKAYSAIHQLLEPLGATWGANRLLQVDLVTDWQRLSLAADVVDTILGGTDVLHRLSRQNDPLASFCSAFVERYEMQEVPLCTALDVENGIGLPGWANGGSAPALTPAADASDATRDSILAELLIRTRSGRELILTDEDIRRLSQPGGGELPSGMAVRAVICSASAQSLANNDYRALVFSAAGPSGMNMIARFCHCDAEIEGRVKAHLAKEQAFTTNAILCEVVHEPEDRIGNVIARPVLRSKEIVFLGGSGAPRQHQLSASDLLVSVRNGRVKLRSRSLDREVVPRITNAHNFVLGRLLPIYKFLALVQVQGLSQARDWSWGNLWRLPFLPRVTWKQCVFARAQWRLSSERIASLHGKSESQRFRAVQALRQDLGLPRLVLLQQVEPLPIDLESLLGTEILVDQVKTAESVLLQEMYPGPEELVVEGSGGRYVHEVIVPIVRSGQREPEAAAKPRRPDNRVRRSFTPLSEWTYVKLYGGEANANRILTDIVLPTVSEGKDSGVIDRWFFLRYRDPHPHIRLRLNGDPRSIRDRVLPCFERLVERFLDDGIVSSLAYDTYVREVERYGGPDAITIAEDVFHADSEATLRLATDPCLSDDDRNLLVLPGIDMMLRAFGLESAESMGHVGTTQLTADERKKWSAYYRNNRLSIERLLADELNIDDRFQSAMEVLRRRSAALESAAHALNRLHLGGQLSELPAEIVPSFVHMHVIRLLHPLNRSFENQCYDVVRRYRLSKEARARTERKTA